MQADYHSEDSASSPPKTVALRARRFTFIAKVKVFALLSEVDALLRLKEGRLAPTPADPIFVIHQHAMIALGLVVTLRWSLTRRWFKLGDTSKPMNSAP